MIRRAIGDDLPSFAFELEAPQEMGQTWDAAGSNTYEPYARPIGFKRDKPRVRVKAWTQPIPPSE